LFSRRRVVIGIVLVAVIAGLVFATGPFGLRPAGAEDDGDNAFLVFSQVFHYLKAYYTGEVKVEDLMDAGLEAMVESLGDKYTVYLSPDEYREMELDMEGEFGGIGITITQEGDYITVVAPLEGTPGAAAGLQAGDKIVAVDGKSIVGWSTLQAVKVMRGDPGTKVVLTVKRGETEPFDVEIIRAVINVPTVKAEVKEGNLGYLRITNFDGNTAADVKKALEELEEKKIIGLVLDLRNNPGGLLNQAVAVAELFVPEGTVVTVQKAQGAPDVYRSETPGLPYPLVVLVNKGSASASEIVAGAIKDYGVGTLVGTQTFGKGSVQSIFGLKNGGGLKVTTAKYLTPKGTSLDGVGLTPNVVVEGHHAWMLKLRDQEPLDFDRNLQVGVIGLDVWRLQRRLNDLSYDAGPEDGIFGPRTERAVRAFQKEQGLEATGLVDEKTEEALNEPAVPRSQRDEKGVPIDQQLQKALEILKEKISSSKAG